VVKGPIEGDLVMVGGIESGPVLPARPVAPVLPVAPVRQVAPAGPVGPADSTSWVSQRTGAPLFLGYVENPNKSAGFVHARLDGGVRSRGSRQAADPEDGDGECGDRAGSRDGGFHYGSHDRVSGWAPVCDCRADHLTLLDEY
jgi:hypothetical protein